MAEIIVEKQLSNVVIVDNSSNIEVVQEAANIVISTVGIQGPVGPSGPFFGVPFFIQSGQPSLAQYSGYTTYAWWQTSSGNTTLWIEDGL
jgi:hypothetical protein